ncbi:hypothetical protein DFQ26_004474 [Actinomortierella ambigua]|nr:hypothetical protein DFQ26_004474 [Actinomortierella ambigua]
MKAVNTSSSSGTATAVGQEDSIQNQKATKARFIFPLCAMVDSATDSVLPICQNQLVPFSPAQSLDRYDQDEDGIVKLQDNANNQAHLDSPG